MIDLLFLTGSFGCMLKRLDIEGMSLKLRTCDADTLLSSGLGDLKSLGL
jgi:hypothetical protein